jgi:hypothetical protein
MKKQLYSLPLLHFICFLIAIKTYAQPTEIDSLLNNTAPKKILVKNAFKSNRIINAHSIEFIAPGSMDFRILHRFGLISEGGSNFFGLDQATMRMSFDFGVLNNLQIGIGRSTFKKEFDGYVKYAPLRQYSGEESFPFTLALAAGVTLNTQNSTDENYKSNFANRLAYFFQTIIGRKFNENLSLQIMPTMVHSNFVPLTTQPNDVFALGLGGRYKVSKRVAITLDYAAVLNGKQKNVQYNPLSVGVDIETGGHVFQLHVSNANGMNERAFITETTNNWSKGQFSFGFNISRMFQLKKQRI